MFGNSRRKLQPNNIGLTMFWPISMRHTITLRKRDFMHRVGFYFARVN